MAGGNGKSSDLVLLRAIESGMGAVPQKIHRKYPRDEIINRTFLSLKSRNLFSPTKTQVKHAAVDWFRIYEHKPRHWRGRPKNKNHPTVILNNDIEAVTTDNGISRAEFRCELKNDLRQVRRKFGTDGLASFLLGRLAGMSSRDIAEIMDFDPNSALAKSLGAISSVETL